MSTGSLPAGWVERTLGEVCEFENGDRGKNYPSRSRYVKSGVPFINAGHLSRGNVQSEDLNFITREDFDLLSKGKIKKGDVLFCLRGSLGKYAMVHDLREGAIASSLVIIRAWEGLDNYFLAYFLGSSLCKNQIEKYRGGTAQPNLGSRDVSKFEIPIPPLPEQQHIVSILDQAFKSVETARTIAEQNREHATNVFESTLDRIFSEGGPDWEEQTLGGVCDFIGGSQPPKSEFVYNLEGLDSSKYIRLVQIRDYKSDKHMVYIPEDRTKKFCSSEDVMIGRYGPPIFQILKGIEGAYNVALMKAVPKTDDLSKEYLFQFLQSRSIQEYVIRSSERAAGQSGVNKKLLNGFKIPIPSLPEQQRIVKQLDALQEQTTALETVYAQKVTALEELTQSLLQDAFSGKLTQEIDA